MYSRAQPNDLFLIRDLSVLPMSVALHLLKLLHPSQVVSKRETAQTHGQKCMSVRGMG